METRPKLLVVDDDPDILDAITTILGTQPYSIDTARDGVECMDKVREDTPDLIILDLLMPRKDGFAVVRELRQNPKYAKLPILRLDWRWMSKTMLRNPSRPWSSSIG